MKKPKYRIPLLDFLLTSMTIILVVSGIYLLFLVKNSNTSAISKTISNPDEIPSTIGEVKSTYSGIKIISEIANDPNTPFAIQYPQSIKYIHFNDQIKKYIKNHKHNYLNDAAKQREQDKDLTAELNISFETFEHHTGTYSFVFVKNQFTGGEKGELDIQTFRLNPKTGESISIEDFFDSNIEHLKVVSKYVQEKLYKDETLKDHLSPDDVAKYTEPIWKNFQNFALTEDSIIFYLSAYKIQENIPILSIPLNEINKMVTKPYKFDESNLANAERPPIQSDGANHVEDQDNNGNEKSTEVNNNDPKQKKVALTFDDGPDPIVTTRILETLEKYDAKATFFMLGSRVEYYPDIAKSVFDAGHEIGNHSWTHPNLAKSKEKKINQEIDRTSAIIEEVTGHKPETFRPPYGAFNDYVLSVIDLPMILWDVDTYDWKHRNANQLLQNVKQNTRDGSIILMHDIHSSTADGLDAVLAYLVENDYSFVTISELSE